MGKAKGKTPDGHRSKFMVRLPESYRELLKKLTAKTRRAVTTEVQIALDKHFKDEKIA